MSQSLPALCSYWMITEELSFMRLEYYCVQTHTEHHSVAPMWAFLSPCSRCCRNLLFLDCSSDAANCGEILHDLAGWQHTNFVRCLPVVGLTVYGVSLRQNADLLPNQDKKCCICRWDKGWLCQLASHLIKLRFINLITNIAWPLCIVAMELRDKEELM